MQICIHHVRESLSFASNFDTKKIEKWYSGTRLKDFYLLGYRKRNLPSNSCLATGCGSRNTLDQWYGLQQTQKLESLIGDTFVRFVLVHCDVWLFFNIEKFSEFGMVCGADSLWSHIPSGKSRPSKRSGHRNNAAIPICGDFRINCWIVLSARSFAFPMSSDDEHIHLGTGRQELVVKSHSFCFRLYFLRLFSYQMNIFINIKGICIM